MNNHEKIGRNEKCYCGSGKKYKKCCLVKDRALLNLPVSALSDLKSEFAKYDQFELVSFLAGLQLCPENHSQLIRLEVAIRIACSIKTSGNKKIEPYEIDQIFKKYLPSEGPIGIKEDPPEGLFTDNVLFFSGNYTVYSGLSRTEPFILRNMLETLFMINKDEFPEDFLNFVYIISQSILVIVNEIANRIGAKRYMHSPDRWRQDIKLPDSDKLKKLCRSVIFTKDEINALLEPYGFDHRCILPFITQIGDKALETEDVDKNPLLSAPMVFLDDQLIVTEPGAMIGALRHFIIVNSSHFGVKDLLVKKYSEKLWYGVKYHLNLMEFKSVKLNLPKWNTNLLFKESVYQIDTDKAAYVVLFNDKLEDYKKDEPYSIWDLIKNVDLISKRCEIITKYLTEKSQTNKVLLILIMGESGRYGSIGTTKMPKNTLTLLMSTEELETISKTKECDSLTLWKFAKALEENKFPAPHSFLDLYSLYKNEGHTFYLSDDVKPDAIFLGPDTIPDLGRKLRIKVADDWDTHTVKYYDSSRYAPVVRIEDSIPIYWLEHSRYAEHMIEGYNLPLWVKCDKKITESRELRGICFEIAGTIAYWLWQFTAELKNHIKNIGNNPILIEFKLENQSTWIANKSLKKMEETKIPPFKNKIDPQNNWIKFEIPSIMLKKLKKVDNEAERILMNEVMKFFGILLVEHHQPNTLTKKERERILGICAPLGMKKKLVILQDEKPSLNPQNLPKLRKLQKDDVQEELKDLALDLGKKSPPIGKILTKEERTNLCNNIVDLYFKKIKSKLSQFAWQPLLIRLIANYESILFYRAINRIFTGPSIECYADISSKVEKEIEDVSEIDNTALSLRMLIEIISAEQIDGKKEISTDEFDNLLAITYNLIHWSIISDLIHFDVIDIEISVLRSGRIGINGLESAWDPFKRSKTLENVETAVENFKYHFESERETKIENPDKEIELVFESEFGISLTDFADFWSILISLGFEENECVPNLQKSQLIKNIKKELEWDDTKIERILDAFSLKKRGKWEIPPDGYDQTDIFPWIYNRRLSYVRKPLIISSEHFEDPIVFFGPRNVYESGLYLLNHIMEGTYKTNENSSEEMKSYKAKMLNMKGKEFTLQVKKWFEVNSDFEVYSEVPIGIGETLNSKIDLGDIDILLIDKSNQTLISIECKDMRYGRSPREIADEIRKIVGEKENKDSWMNKHMKRDKWLNNHRDLLKSTYGFDSNTFKIYSLFLFSQEISSIYFKKMELKAFTFPKLKRKGSTILTE